MDSYLIMRSDASISFGAVAAGYQFRRITSFEAITFSLSLSLSPCTLFLSKISPFARKRADKRRRGEPGVVEAKDLFTVSCKKKKKKKKGKEKMKRWIKKGRARRFTVDGGRCVSVERNPA